MKNFQVILFSTLLLSCSPTATKTAKHYKEEAAKAPGAVQYKYVKPATDRESLVLFFKVAAPMVAVVFCYWISEKEN